MKVIINEKSIELVPENDHERQALKKVAGKAVTIQWTDSWEQTGNLEIKLPKDSWDER